MVSGDVIWREKGKGEIPLTALPVELAEGMNKVVQPVAGLWIETRSGWWIADLSCTPAECSCRAEMRAFWKPSNSSTVRFSRRDRIWSSVRTVRVIVAVVAEKEVMLSVRLFDETKTRKRDVTYYKSE